MIHGTRLLLVAALLLAGCGGMVVPPVRQVKSPEGGEVVLTSTEREALAAEGKEQPRTIAPAIFEQPGQPLRALAAEPDLKPFERWTEPEAAADALGRIGSPAVPALVQALQSGDAHVRLQAAEVLGRMGDGAQDAVPELTRLLADPDVSVRKAAARTLGHIGPAAKDAVPALMQSLLQDPARAPR